MVYYALLGETTHSIGLGLNPYFSVVIYSLVIKMYMIIVINPTSIWQHYLHQSNVYSKT